MNFNQLKQSILGGDYSPVYVFYGEEFYFIDQLTKLIEESILNEGEKSFNQIVLYGRDIDFKTIVDNARQFPMMSERRVVVVREGQNLKDFDQLLSYFEKPSDHTILAIALKGKKPDKRKKIWKVLAKNATLFDSKRVYDNQLPAWIDQYLSGSKIKIEPRASVMIAEFLGTSLSKVANELDKLVLNKKESDTITVDDVLDQIGINKDFNIFELQSALGQKDSSKAFQIVKYFADNAKSNPLFMTIPSLSSYFTKLALTHFHINDSDPQFMRSVGVGSTYFIRDYKSAARNYSQESLKKIFGLLHQADLKSKGVSARNQSDMGIYQELITGILTA